MSEEGLLVGYFILQLIVEVVDGRGLPLCCQVALLQRGDPFLHVLLLSHRLQPQMNGCSSFRHSLRDECSSIPLSGPAAAAYSCLQT